MIRLEQNTDFAGPSGWRGLLDHAGFALGLVWQGSPRLCSALITVEIIDAFVPVLFALTVGLSIGEAKQIFEGTGGNQGKLAAALGIAALLALMSTLVAIARDYVRSRLTDELRVQLSTEVLRHLATLDLAQFEDPAMRDVIERASSEPGGSLVGFVTTAVPIATQGFQIASLTAVLLYVEPMLTPVLLLAGVPALLIRWRMARLNYETLRAQTTVRRWSTYFANTLSDTHFFPTVRLYDLAPVLLDQCRGYLRQILSINLGLYRRQAIGGALASVVVTAAALGLVVWVGYRTAAGDVSVALFGTFVISINRMQECIRSFVDAVARSLEKVLFVSNLRELLETESLRPKDGTIRPTHIEGNIELKGVCFTYSGSSDEVLHDIDMTLPAGKTVAVIGPNGCGKTTLTRVISRLDDVTSGEVLLDGHDIRDMPLAFLHEGIAYVGQHVIRFEASASDNIAYGNWAALSGDPATVRTLAEHAGTAPMIAKFPDGFDTRLGRRFGTYDLSGGQWQQIAITRALAKPASILILDEPTASLDANAEAEMYRGLQRLAAGRTTLLISHRFSTVAMADYIYVLDEGRVVDHGSHKELLARGGVYAAMYEIHHRAAGDGDHRSRDKNRS